MGNILMKTCDACFEAKRAYCPHRGVLRMRIRGTRIAIRSATERQARAIAEQLRAHWTAWSRGETLRLHDIKSDAAIQKVTKERNHHAP